VQIDLITKTFSKMKKLKQEELTGYSNEELIRLVEELQSAVKKKSDLVYQLRVKLAGAKSKINIMKGKVMFQRKRILELYQ
jgi:hypothetical protein